MKAIDLNEKSAWEEFNLSFPSASFLQAWSAGEMHQHLGKKIIRRGYLVNQRLKGIALLIKEKARRGTHLICPGGPVLDWQDLKLARFVLADIVREGQTERAIFVRLRPNILDQTLYRQLFRQASFHRAPMHLAAETTWELSLAQTDKELLRGMRKGTRSAIRKTRRSGVVVTQSKDPVEAKLLYDLQQATVQRHHFVPFSQDFFVAHAQAYLPEQLLFLKARRKGEVLATAMIVYYGKEAVYHYAASKKSPPGLSPPSLIIWEAILEAKRRGCLRFNFWGVAPTDDPDHRFAGLTRFKQGFGGERVFYLRAQDKGLKPSYWLIYAFETLRRLRRRL